MAKKRKTLAKLKAELQPLFNKFIRQRDSQDGWFTCISCGKDKKTDQMDAGHFYPVKGYDSLRFNEDNCHGECKGCNGFDPMHLLGYVKNLEHKIGLSRLCDLSDMSQDYRKNGHKWSRPDLEEMIIEYKSKINTP